MVDLDDASSFPRAMMEVMRREGVELGGKAILAGDPETVQKAQEALMRYPKKWVDVSNLGTTYIRTGVKRGFCTNIYRPYIENLKAGKIKDHHREFLQMSRGKLKVGDSFIALDSPDRFTTVTIHEFGHRLQAAMPKLDKYFEEMWLERTKGEVTKPLANFHPSRGTADGRYGLSEVGREDHFPLGYMGRNYGTDERPLPAEMLTMTFQILLGEDKDGLKELLGRGKFHKDGKIDDVFHLGIALLTRFGR